MPQNAIAACESIAAARLKERTASSSLNAKPSSSPWSKNDCASGTRTVIGWCRWPSPGSSAAGRSVFRVGAAAGLAGAAGAGLRGVAGAAFGGTGFAGSGFPGSGFCGSAAHVATTARNAAATVAPMRARIPVLMRLAV
jgi:hypothetical protein